MMYQLSVKITTLTPVILAQSSGENIMATTEEFFSGTVVRGLLAEKFIRDKRLTAAEQDEEFYKFFLSGDIAFGPAYCMLPKVGTVQPVPLSLTHDKKKEKIFDLALGQKGETGFKGMKGFGHIGDDGKIVQVAVKKNLELHMSRQSDGERIVGSSTDGQMYNYEALSAGQSFESIIMGEKDVLEQLASNFSDLHRGATMYIGRSKHTQYGKCFVEMGTVKPCDMAGVRGRVALKFITDYLPMDECFSSAQQALADITEVLKDKGIELQIEDVFSAVGERDGFVSVWGLKRSAKRCLKAGTVVVLAKNDWTGDELKKIQDLGWYGCGERRIDGFGRFELYDLDLPKSFAASKDDKDKFPGSFGKPFSKQVKEIVTKILENRIIEKLQNIGAEDIKGRRVREEGNNHFFARMEELCESRKKFKEELRDNSNADMMLSKLGKGISLKEILYGNKPAPYEKRWQEVITEDMRTLAEETGAMLPEASDEKIFHIYWQWYWRMARKNNRRKEERK